MRRFLLLVAIVSFVLPAGGLWAQTVPRNASWIQLRALPTQIEALDEIAEYEQRFGNVVGYTMGTGWHAIVLGPYARTTALSVLQDLKNKGLVPGDAFLAGGRQFREQFWPADGTLPVADMVPGQAPVVVAETTPEPVAEVPEQTATEASVVEPVVPDETREQALASESLLTRDKKKDLQTALQWAGVYSGAIDGLYGKGTRASMTAWQTQNGYDPTGVMTTAQRAELWNAFNAILNSLALQTTDDRRAGIRVAVPTAFVGDPTYTAPFVHFGPKDNSGAELLLISQTGDRNRLAALYDVLLTLDILPEGGNRKLSRSSFVIEGQNSTRHSVAFAQLSDGMIKGAVLAWPQGDSERQARAWQEITKSFQTTPGVLDDADFLITGDQPVDLVAGLTVRQPLLVQSGVFVDAKGHVLTAQSNLQSCGRIELDHGQNAEIVTQSEHVAVLAPQRAIAPLAVARLQTAAPKVPAKISVGGYSHGGILGAPTVTYGRLEALSDIDNNPERARMKIEVMQGDIGGPVFDQSGAVLGVLLPRPDNSGRVAPQDQNHTALWPQVSALLENAGVDATTANGTGDVMHPVDLSNLARDAVVLVKCWE